MQEKLVSICIPTYVQTHFLKKCLDSVFRQTYTNYEVIISDDTPDNSLKKFLDANYPDKKINYYHHALSLGSPANWNFAISKAQGEYIKILHHDDYFTSENSLDKFVSTLQNNAQCDFCFSLSHVQNQVSESLSTTSVSSEMIKLIKKNPTQLISGNVMGSPSATMHRKMPIVYDEKLKWLVDVDFYITCLFRNTNFCFINEPLITTTNEAQHQITNTCLNNPQVELFEYCYLVDKYATCIVFNKAIKNVFLNLFYNYGINNLNQLKPFFKNVLKQKEFYNPVFKQQKYYNFKRSSILKIKALLGKTT
jgi:glycosyltransferase involved in cell wall biosynthesis